MDADSGEQEPQRSYATRRLTVLVLGVSVLVLLAAGIRSWATQDPERPASGIEAWVPYWAVDDALGELPARADSLMTVSPFWFAAVGPDTILADDNRSVAATEAFMAAARGAGLPLVPSILDAMPAGGMAEVLSDPATRARHVDAVMAFVDDNDFDGVDIDYEQFAFADDRSTWASTRPHWVSFVEELSTRIRQAGKVLTVSIPPVYDDGRTSTSGFWVYDYGSIAPLVDRIRIMAYDYSTSAPGPIAPLEWVQQAIDGTISASGGPEKLALGIPLYGYNWAVGTTGQCPAEIDSGRTSVTTRSVGELASRRGGSPIYDPVTGEWSFGYDLAIGDASSTCVQRRQVNYVGVDGAQARIELARRAGIPVVSLWALGYDDPAFWPSEAEG